MDSLAKKQRGFGTLSNKRFYNAKYGSVATLPMLALPKVTLKRPERNETKLIIENILKKYLWGPNGARLSKITR